MKKFWMSDQGIDLGAALLRSFAIISALAMVMALAYGLVWSASLLTALFP